MSLLPPNSPIPAIVTILAIATILTFFLQSGMKSIRNVDFSIVSETRREASVSESGKDTDAFSVTDIQDENVLPVRDSEPSLEKPLLPPSQPTLRRNAPKNRTASEGFVNKNFTNEGSASEDSPNDVIHASSRYAGCSEMDIALSNGQVWASCNVWATQAWTERVLKTCADGEEECRLSYLENRNVFGEYFQWGRNDGIGKSPITDELVPLLNKMGGAGHSKFVVAEKMPTDWIANPEPNLWWGGLTFFGSGTYAEQRESNRKAMRGPCNDGYHVPTQKEWCDAMVAISPSIKKCESGSIYGKATREFVSGLKLPRAGGRSYATGNYFNQGSTANYWTSTAHQNVAHTIHFVTTVILDPHYGLSRAYGFPVRCIKN